MEWVDVISALALAGGEGGRRPQAGPMLDLETEFAMRFFWPIVLQISDLGSPEVPQVSAYRVLSATVDRLGLAHFGSVYTRLALPVSARSRPPPRSWAAEARVLLHEALRGHVGAGTTERCVVYAAASLIWRDEVIEMPGMVYYSLPRGPPAPIGETPEDKARDMLKHVHRHILRDNHAERAALLAIMTTAVRLCGDTDGSSELPEFIGIARVYASQVPCVSCVSVGAQFSRFFPLVHLEFAFEDAWREQPGNANKPPHTAASSDLHDI